MTETTWILVTVATLMTSAAFLVGGIALLRPVTKDTTLSYNFWTTLGIVTRCVPGFALIGISALISWTVTDRIPRWPSSIRIGEGGGSASQLQAAPAPRPSCP